MSDEVVLGLIGCGGNMGAHVRGYNALWEAGLRGFRIAATCDIDEGKAQKLADSIAEFQGARPTVYTDFRRMLDAESSVDAVDISIVHSEHHKVAVPCLEAGKHVTIEKPLAITCRAAHAILDAATQAGVVLQTAENYRRVPEHRAASWALREGMIGDPRLLYWVDVGERVWYWGWREDRDLAGGGWSMDGGVHFADLFRYHVGDVATLYAISRAHSTTRYRNREDLTDPVEVSVEDTTMAVLEFANGVSGEWSSTNVAPGHGFSNRAVYGSEGSLTWGVGLTRRGEDTVPMKDLIAQHHVAIGEDGVEALFPSGVTDSIATEVWEFLQAVRGEGNVETDGVEGLKALAICMSIYESSSLGEAVDVTAVENCDIETYQADLNEAAGF